MLLKSKCFWWLNFIKLKRGVVRAGTGNLIKILILDSRIHNVGTFRKRLQY